MFVFVFSFVHSQSDLLHQRKWATDGAARRGGQGQISSGNSYTHNTQIYSAICTSITLSKPRIFIYLVDT